MRAYCHFERAAKRREQSQSALQSTINAYNPPMKLGDSSQTHTTEQHPHTWGPGAFAPVGGSKGPRLAPWACAAAHALACTRAPAAWRIPHPCETMYCLSAWNPNAQGRLRQGDSSLRAAHSFRMTVLSVERENIQKLPKQSTSGARPNL